MAPDPSHAEASLGAAPDNRARFDAAQRTIALRWLAVLWKQSTRRVEEFTVQYERVRALQARITKLLTLNRYLVAKHSPLQRRPSTADF